MKRVLITGNSGYIGSHLSHLLKQDPNLELYGLDKDEPIVKLSTFCLHDITDTKPLLYQTEQAEFDCVVHLASTVNVPRSFESPSLYFETIVNGTKNILQNIKFDHFIYASSGSAEAMISPYGIAKRMAEILVEDWCRKNNKEFSLLRFYNVTGTSTIKIREDTILNKLIQARAEGFFNIYGADYDTIDGTPIKDYTHVLEVVDAINKIIYTPANNIEHFGHCSPLTVKQVIDIFKHVNSCDFEVRIEPRRIGDVGSNVAMFPSRYLPKVYSTQELFRVW